MNAGGRWFPKRDVPWQSPEKGPGNAPIGLGGTLEPALLLRAYSEGVFPWYSEGDPLLWWSPDPRGIFEIGSRQAEPGSEKEPRSEFHVSHRLARTIRSGKFRTTVNTAFFDVMRECGEERDEGTWITEEMLTAYLELHRQGHAHSVEVWQGDKLVGGTYGVVVGGLFAGESMFHRVTDASKVALAALVDRLRERGYVLFDIQMVTDHTASLGAIEVRRGEYLQRLREAVGLKKVTFV